MDSRSPALQTRLETLVEQFARFREHAKPHQRVPQSLRVAAVTLVQAGVKPSIVGKRCGLQTAQLKAWRERVDVPSMLLTTPRVLQVVASPVGDNSEARARVTIEGKKVVIELPF